MQTFLIGGISLLAGGAMAGATIVGVVNTRTADPSVSPTDVSKTMEIPYGTTN